MKVYDISQEILSCVVFPGDPAPKKETVCAIAKGDICNLTAFSMCAHNGTHVDAPCHFIDGAKSVEALSLEKLVGMAYVAERNCVIDADDARCIVETAKAANADSAKRILIKGKATVSLEAADTFATMGVVLVGNESQTVGPEDGPMAVHHRLLGDEIVLLEGVRLAEVNEGVYLLCAAPISIAGADGAPCRAVLIGERE